MKNLTVSVPEAVYVSARVHAAERGTSVSALVADWLRTLGKRDAEFARLAAQQRQVQASIRGFSARDRLSRDAVHERAIR